MKTIAVYTAYDWDHALVELRITGPARHAGLEVLRGTHGAETYPDQVRKADLVIVQRDFPRDTAGWAQVTDLAKAGGIPVVYDLDDLIFDLPEDHPDRAIHYYTDALVTMLQALAAAQAVTASTPALREVLGTYHPHVYYLPNLLEDGYWSFRPPPWTGPGQPVTIGYMGGSSHAPDLESISPTLQAVAQEYGDRIRFHFWGGAPPAALASRANVAFTELDLRYPAYAEYCRAQTADIFIAPLQDNLFNRCKSPVKFLEYSSLGVPGVYSRVGPYAEAVTHGEDGFLAAGRDEWETALRRLIDDPDLRQAIGARAQKTVQAHWLLSSHAHRWPETYREILALDPPSPDPIRDQAVAAKLAQLEKEVQHKKAAEARPESFRARIRAMLARFGGGTF